MSTFQQLRQPVTYGFIKYTDEESRRPPVPGQGCIVKSLPVAFLHLFPKTCCDGGPAGAVMERRPASHLQRGVY